MGLRYGGLVTLLTFLLGTYSCDGEMGGKGWCNMSCQRVGVGVVLVLVVVVVVVEVVIRYEWVDGWVLGVRLEGKGGGTERSERRKGLVGWCGVVERSDGRSVLVSR